MASRFTMRLEGWSVVALVNGTELLYEEIEHVCGQTVSVEEPIHVMVDHVC